MGPLHLTQQRLSTPDPVLSANIYAAGRLDDLMANAIVPFASDAESAHGPATALWVVKYGIRGDYLKVRVHSHPGNRESLKDLLMARTQEFFRNQDDPDSLDSATRAHTGSQERKDDAERADCRYALRWTRYERCPVSLPAPWLVDDEFAELSCSCLACACKLVLAGYREGVAAFGKSRQKLLLKALTTGLAASGIREPAAAAAYLRYHRDWLLRFFLRTSDAEQTGLRIFHNHAHSAGDTLNGIGRALQTMWSHRSVPSDLWLRWSGALAELTGWLRRCSKFDYRLADPYASDVTFLPLFKVFHGLANQIGLPPLQEAYTCHLTLAALCPGALCHA
jgi:hypothetical protein